MDEQTKRGRRPYGTGSVYQPKGSRFLWIKFHINGVPHRESTHTDNRRKANEFLKNRLSQIGTGTFVGRKSERLTVRELADDFLREYRVNRRKSIDDVKARWNLHLKPFFAHRRAASVSSDLIVQYVDCRQQQRAANATINRELAALKRMFRLGAQATPPKVNRVPHFEMLEERNVRTGFIDDKQFSALSAECAKVGLWFRALLEVAYTYGWRLRELLNLRVDQVDLALRVIRLEPGTTKNEEGREVTMTESVFVLLQECVHRKGPDNYVFTRKNGKRVLDFRGAWESVCEKAGLPNLLFHDLRRSAARNLRRAGVAEGVIQKIGGWKTRSVFERYAIVDQRDIAQAMERLQTSKIGHNLGIAFSTEASPRETVKSPAAH